MMTYKDLIAVVRKYEADFRFDRWNGSWFRFDSATGEIYIDDVRDERYDGYWIYQNYIPHYNFEGEYLGFGTYSELKIKASVITREKSCEIAGEDQVHLVWRG